MYGDKEGFYDWIEQMKIPGDIEDRTYLELLYKIHPELKPESWKKMGMTEDEQIMKNAKRRSDTAAFSELLVDQPGSEQKQINVKSKEGKYEQNADNY